MGTAHMSWVFLALNSVDEEKLQRNILAFRNRLFHFQKELSKANWARLKRLYKQIDELSARLRNSLNILRLRHFDRGRVTWLMAGRFVAKRDRPNLRLELSRLIEIYTYL